MLGTRRKADKKERTLSYVVQAIHSLVADMIRKLVT